MGYCYHHVMAIKPFAKADIDRIVKWMTTGYEAPYDWAWIFGIARDGFNIVYEGYRFPNSNADPDALVISGNHCKSTLEEQDLKRLGKAFPDLTFRITRDGELPLDYTEMYVHGETVEIVHAKIDPPKKVEW